MHLADADMVAFVTYGFARTSNRKNGAPRQTSRIVSNESSEIIRMFNSAFNDLTGNSDDYCPPDLRADIDAINADIYECINNGVYRAGFATTHAAYADAVTKAHR